MRVTHKTKTMKHRISASVTTLCVLAALSMFTSCGGGSSRAGGYVSMDGFALGTTYHITVNSADTTGLAAAMDSVFRVADNSMSIYNPGSLLSRLNRNETDSVDVHIERCIEIARQMSELSGGVYDVTVKPLTDAWGFGIDDGVQREMPNVGRLLEYVGYERITVEDGRLVKQDRRMEIDLNSIAKGYTVDLLGEAIAARGIRDYIVEVGGEIVCRGMNPGGIPWVVGIDRPADGNMLPGVDMQARLSFTNAALATSGNYRRHYTDDQGRKVVHTFDAVTGHSVSSNLLSATVVAGDCATADALATTLMAVGLEPAKYILEENPQWAGYLIYADDEGGFSVYRTPRMAEYILD